MKSFTTIVCPFLIGVVTPQLHGNFRQPERLVIVDELLKLFDAAVFNVDGPMNCVLFKRFCEIRLDISFIEERERKQSSDLDVKFGKIGTVVVSRQTKPRNGSPHGLVLVEETYANVASKNRSMALIAAT